MSQIAQCRNLEEIASRRRNARRAAEIRGDRETARRYPSIQQRMGASRQEEYGGGACHLAIRGGRWSIDDFKEKYGYLRHICVKEEARFQNKVYKHRKVYSREEERITPIGTLIISNCD